MGEGVFITVRTDDKPLVRKRLGELTQIGGNLRWFFPLRAPHHLDWRDLNDMEIEWAELPHHDLVNFLDVGLEAPPSEWTPVALICVAQGLGRWPDVLRLLRDHPEELPAKMWADQSHGLPGNAALDAGNSHGQGRWYPQRALPG
jgi:hypothetical protein